VFPIDTDYGFIEMRYDIGFVCEADILIQLSLIDLRSEKRVAFNPFLRAQGFSTEQMNMTVG
jgi:hypothetical protein